jgi:hypothetical protein
MTPAANKFILNPSTAISRIVNRPLPNTTELGAVATGNMKAQLALIAAGTMINSGLIPADIAVAAKMGISRVVLAVFEVVSVANVTIRHIAKMSRYEGITVS